MRKVQILRSAYVFSCLCACVCVCASKSERVRRQEIARVVRVGSTPRGTEKEQREHLPPHQEQLFNPLRRGDAGMGGGEVGAAKAKKGVRHSSSSLLFSFTCSPLQSLQPPHLPPPLPPPPSFIPSRVMETDGVDVFFFPLHFSTQTNFRKYQLSACMHIASLFFLQVRFSLLNCYHFILTLFCYFQMSATEKNAILT